MRVDILGTHRLPLAGVANDDIAKPRLEIVEILGEAEDRHDFGCDRDVEARFTRIAVGDPAERANDFAERAVVHIHHAAPGDAARVEAGGIAPVNVVVDQRGKQIVRRGDRVEVAGEVEIDVFHRHDLGITAAGSTTLHAEARAERRLAQRAHRLLADVIECVGQAYGGRGLAFARGRRRNRGDENELAVFLAFQRLDVVHRDLGLVVAIGLEILRVDAETFFGDIHDRPHLCGLCDFDVRFRILML